MTSRVVRVTADLFHQFEYQLPAERGRHGEPSVAEFAAADLLDIVDAFATLWDDLPLTFPGRDANLRTAAGLDPYDKGLHDLVGELSTRSEEFRRRWGSHNVRTHGSGTKHFHHSVVGDLDLAYESMDLRTEPGLAITVYAAQPGSPSAPTHEHSPTKPG